MEPDLRKDAAEVISEFIVSKVEDAGADGVVLGISGGVDSALTMALCANALGAEGVTAFLLPGHNSSEEDERDAADYAATLGIIARKISVSSVADEIQRKLEMKDAKAKGNVNARIRMVILYAFANEHNRLVAGTSNKSEFLTGYYTKYGDGASDMCPLGDLYKTQVWMLARKMGVPEKIVSKKPTAGLWPGQTDEAEMGITYAELDSILYCLERGMSGEEIVKATGLPSLEIEKVRLMIKRTAHKRSFPVMPKLGLKTALEDWGI
ncbi:MAG: NAD+ synthase [Methanomassiliicoccales archaeon]